MNIGFDRSTAHVNARLTGLVAILSTLPANGQDAAEQALPGNRLDAIVAEGRELVLLPPYEQMSDGPQGAQSPVGGLSVQSFPTATQQTVVVSFEGKTFRAALPLDGRRTQLAFDPARRAFVELSGSLRIELDEGVDLDAVTDAVGATRIAVFESTGFAIVGLPEDLHPAEAVSRVRNLPGRPDAAVRLRAPRIRWR